MTGDYVSDLRAFCTKWLKQNAGCDLIDHGFGAEHGGELTTGKLGTVLDELERLRKDVAKLGEHVAPVDDREPMDVNWAAEALYAYAEQRSTQSQFGNQLRAVLDSRQSWRYRAFKLEDNVEQLRAQVADFPDQLADAQEVALDKLVEAFGEGWDNCRMHLEDEGRLKRGVAVTQYSNQLPWPTYVAPQRPDLDALCVRDAMADAAMRQPESGSAK